MASQTFLLRAKRLASLVACNAALPSNFKLIVKPGSTWVEAKGVELDPVTSLTLKKAILDGDGNVTTPAVQSTDAHYNLRVTPDWAGWDGIMIDESDPDYDGDPRLDRSKIKQWFKNNGAERLDSTTEHPRSGRTMRWFRWSNATEWLDITIDEPQHRRRVWA